MKLVPLQPVLDTMPLLGWPNDIGLIRALGSLTIAITALYLWPRTAPLGAVLLTGYLGGAIATHLPGSAAKHHAVRAIRRDDRVGRPVVARSPASRVGAQIRHERKLAMVNVRSFLWFADHAREAVRFYTTVIPNSSCDDIHADDAE